MESNSIILKFDHSTEQTVGSITKIVGLVKAKGLIPVIDNLNLEANPRSSKTGPVTDAIQASITGDPQLFPFMTKGILLAASKYETLDRKRYKITPDNPAIEGILDGGHNTIAIGLYILREAMAYFGLTFPRGAKNWDDFKNLWKNNRDSLSRYLEVLRNNPDVGNLDFYVPIELLVPSDPNNFICVESFKINLIDICAARNNNVQLQVSDKANQMGYFDVFRTLFEERNPALAKRIEWKSNDGGDIKVQDITALAWIPLSLAEPVKDENGKTVEPISPNKLYSGKGSCLKQFERLMSSPEVTIATTADYKRELKNSEVTSALKIAVELPELYDYIFAHFPANYNAAGGKYGGISAVKALNEKRVNKTAPFTNVEVDTISPDGFIVPLVYGLQALMVKETVGNLAVIRWIQPPLPFLISNLDKIVKSYSGIISVCDYDPQKVGKEPQSYVQALNAYKMALAGIL